MLAAIKAFDRHILPVVPKSCAGLLELRLGKQVHRAIFVNGFALDLVSLNALISMCVKCGDLAGTRKVFDRMLIRNEISWFAILAGYGMHGVFGMEAGERPDVVTFTTVRGEAGVGALYLYGGYVRQGGTGGGGRGVGLGMTVEPDEALWGALLGSCRIHGKVEVAERVEQMLYGRRLAVASLSGIYSEVLAKGHQ
ncbi:PREDICTED: pentatricopeptide [Prunus dulcis]|uniref:PREDICTED: pentatricopeptide n=1 Tax=Prunus dulcis TaxID=3755 RepID=A0A5E4FF43_PRUDU|nr:PREDICTED: pentatricopeptide [Prunus dulcis]